MQAVITDPNHFKQLRQTMVDVQLRERDIYHPAVLQVMEIVPRHLFVPEHFQQQSYEDYPLDIGLEQTISQPYMVALMTQVLLSDTEPLTEKAPLKVLEIGTGCGYQTAILAELFQQVYTIERHEPLSNTAKDRLEALQYNNIHFKVGDGCIGWPEFALFDAIILTAAAPSVPPPLMNQLNTQQGKILLPLAAKNDPKAPQSLVMLERTAETIKRHDFGGVRFVPLIGHYGFKGLT